MLRWTKKGTSDTLLLFVHGLMGGEGTWNSPSGISFPQLIAEDPELVDKFDIVCFDYYSTWNRKLSGASNLMQRIFRLKNKTEKNLPIDEISELLQTNFVVEFGNYKKVIILAHSMGGLISKSCIIKQITKNLSTNIVGFISIAVPHSGSAIANYASFISSHAQLKDLSVLSSEIDKLNREWMGLPFRPLDRYLYGSYDDVVTKQSAIAIHSNDRDNYLALDEGHLSICKPTDRDTLSYKSTLKYVMEINNKTKEKETLDIQNLTDKEMYNDEYFVLKLVIADVHDRITGQAKEYFYNAERARKLFTSDEDKKDLKYLYDRVNEIYQIEYQYFLCQKGAMSSEQLLYSVHSKIMEKNDIHLKSRLHNLSTTHKSGMLHQLANCLDDKVIWTDSFDQDSLKSLKEEKNE
ncbi:ABC-three component system protein [Serratia marcescens]|uniref:ABC-three component system protein n=1 Tax=Serratia marcescens TaxID=615 RepID=UPI001F14B410|nr:ABC-three component system protein [Serratia marcescens]